MSQDGADLRVGEAGERGHRQKNVWAQPTDDGRDLDDGGGIEADGSGDAERGGEAEQDLFQLRTGLLTGDVNVALQTLSSSPAAKGSEGKKQHSTDPDAH